MRDFNQLWQNIWSFVGLQFAVFLASLFSLVWCRANCRDRVQGNSVQRVYLMISFAKQRLDFPPKCNQTSVFRNHVSIRHFSLFSSARFTLDLFFSNFLYALTSAILSWSLFPDLSVFYFILALFHRLCGLVVRVLGYRSGGPGSIPGTTRKK
jgi:hypothetical protein